MNLQKNLAKKLLKKRRTPLGIAVLFVSILVCFHLLLRISLVYNNTILPFTVWVTEASTFFLNLLNAGVSRIGKEIVTSDFLVRIEINDGCNGLFASAILLAAILSQPSSVKAKLTGLGLGLPLLFILNQFRIISLFYIRLSFGKANMEFFHVYFWQALMILCSVMIWMAWSHFFVFIKRSPKERHAG